MALTFTFTDDNAVEGDQRVRRGRITFDNSYPTGGEVVAASDFKLNRIDYLDIASVNRLGNRLVSFDDVNSKIQLWTALGTEAGNASDQSTSVVPFTARGD